MDSSTRGAGPDLRAVGLLAVASVPAAPGPSRRTPNSIEPSGARGRTLCSPSKAPWSWIAAKASAAAAPPSPSHRKGRTGRLGPGTPPSAQLPSSTTGRASSVDAAASSGSAPPSSQGSKAISTGGRSWVGAWEGSSKLAGSAAVNGDRAASSAVGSGAVGMPVGVPVGFPVGASSSSQLPAGDEGSPPGAGGSPARKVPSSERPPSRGAGVDGAPGSSGCGGRSEAVGSTVGSTVGPPVGSAAEGSTGPAPGSPPGPAPCGRGLRGSEAASRVSSSWKNQESWGWAGSTMGAGAGPWPTGGRAPPLPSTPAPPQP